MKGKLIYVIVAAVIISMSCKKAYIPQLTTVSTNFLAIDGPIISGDSTFIRLSRSTNLADTTQNKPELKATVFVESDQNALYSLTEKGSGLYVLGITTFDLTHKYRLNVKTSNGKIYQSDFVPMKNTGSIDSVYFEAKDNNHILFYLNAHDATNSTRYYRWDYKETWRNVSLYKYIFSYKNGVVSYRDYNDLDISTCYKTGTSNEIFVGSSINQSNDIITHQQLGGINNTTEKIVRGYVLQVRQYALTREGFEYYQNLKTSEQLGSLFDPQASFLKGNIRCISNPGESVIGFISVSTATTKQVNLSYFQIPINYVNYYGTMEWLKYHFYNSYTPFRPDPGDCPEKTVSIPAGSTLQYEADALLKRGLIIFDAEFSSGAPVYFYAPKECIDCRLQGGTTTKPSYFPFN